MSRAFKIYSEMNLIVVRFTGPIDFQDIYDWVNEAYKSEEYSKAYDGIVDFRDAVFKQTRPKKILELVAHMLKLDFTKGTWGILVNSPMETALSLIYTQEAAQTHPVSIFSTVEGAAKFIGRSFYSLNNALEL